MADSRQDLDWVPPRAPSQEAWDAMSSEERRRTVDALPSWMTEGELTAPEGDLHYLAKEGARDALTGWFRGRARGFYVGAEAIVYYPDERRFSPDICVVLDVEPGTRERWVVSDEGKGLDFTLEILVSGDRRKDLRDNVRRFAHLGIPEYFVYEVREQRIHGWRLPPGGSVYQPILAQRGRYASETLGLELANDCGRLRFFAGNATVYETPELLEQLSKTTTQLHGRLIEAAAALEASERVREESERVREESERAREGQRAELEAALAEIARLKGET